MDKRELVLKRIAAICATTGATVKRMAVRVNFTERPAIVINDGDESIELGKTGRTPMIVTLRPQLILMVQGEEPAPLVNALRAKVLKALLTDETLATLLGEHGSIKYLGLETGIKQGETMEADMALNFEANYRLTPADL